MSKRRAPRGRRPAARRGAAHGRRAGKGFYAGLLGATVLVTVVLVALIDRDRLEAAWRAYRHPGLLDRPRAAVGESPPAPPTLDDALDDAIAAEFAALSDDARVLEDFKLADLRPADLDVPITRRTLRYVRFFAKDPQGRRAFEVMYRRAGRYRAAMDPELRRVGLPTDLVWLAAIESLFDPEATSPAGAAGLWQFMPSTGRSYGLAINPFIDDRRHVERSTAAAASHLRDLRDELGRLDLALAAYNAGRQRIAGALMRYRKAHQGAGSIDFADLARDELLPKETADYVPKLTAVAIVAAHRKRFDFEAVVPDPPREVAHMAVPGETRLATIARACSISLGELRRLNPELLQARLPAGPDIEVAVPAGRLQHALVTLSVYLEQEDSMVASAPAPPTPRVILPDSMLPPAPPERTLGPQPLVFDMPSLDGPRNDVTPFPFKPLLTSWPMQGGVTVVPLGEVKTKTERAIEEALTVAAPVVHEAEVGGVTLAVRPEPQAKRIVLHAEVGTIRLKTEADDLELGLHDILGQVAWLHEAGRGGASAGLRARLNRHRRAALARHADGAAYLALSDTMFAGRLIDPRGLDAAWVRDRAMLDDLSSKRTIRLDVAGPVESAAVEQMTKALLGPLGLGKEGHEPSWTSVPVTRIDGRPRVLMAWRGPGIDARGHGTLVVAAELLRVALKEAGVDARVRLDADFDESALVIEVTPGVAPARGEVARVLQGMIDEPPERSAVAQAKARIRIRLKRALKQTSLNPTRMWELRRKGVIHRLLGRIGATGPTAVRKLVTKLPEPVVVEATPARPMQAKR